MLLIYSNPRGSYKLNKESFDIFFQGPKMLGGNQEWHVLGTPQHAGVDKK
jgi:hypothetical protein